MLRLMKNYFTLFMRKTHNCLIVTYTWLIFDWIWPPEVHIRTRHVEWFKKILIITALRTGGITVDFISILLFSAWHFNINTKAVHYHPKQSYSCTRDVFGSNNIYEIVVLIYQFIFCLYNLVANSWLVDLSHGFR